MAEPQYATTPAPPRGALPLLQATSRGRTVLFVTLNLVGFVAVNAFWQYLATGRWLDLSPAAFQHGFDQFGEMFLKPLSIFHYPWLILVIAGLLSVVFLTPVIVAVLYHEVVAIAFVLVVAGVGHAPGLALFQIAGCVLAARTRLRNEAPFLATLLGMVPLGIYLVSALAVGEPPVARPLQRWVLWAPVAAAVVFSILGAVIVLALARLTAYRPGVVWPVLAVLLLGPVILFHVQIGTDDLDYALIANELTEADALFESEPLDRWRREHQGEGLNPEALENRIQGDLKVRKDRLLERCRAFPTDHPDSGWAPAVLWISAQAQSLKLDDISRRAGLVKYSAAFALAESEPVWERLLKKHPTSPHAALAAWKLGQLAIRRKDMRLAGQRLRLAVDRLGRHAAKRTAHQKYEGAAPLFFPRVAAPAGRNWQYYQNAWFSAWRLVWIMEENHVADDPASAEALAALQALNPRSAAYLEDLDSLAERYEGTQMGDNLILAYALATPNVYRRAEMLIELAKNKNTDAAIEATFALGMLAMKTAQAPAIGLIEGLKKPEDYLHTVYNTSRDNPWRGRALERLHWLASQPKSGP